MAKSTSTSTRVYHTDDTLSRGWFDWSNDRIKPTFVNSYQGMREASGIKIGDRVQFKMPMGSWGAGGEDRIRYGRVVAFYPTYFRVQFEVSGAMICFTYHAIWDKEEWSKVTLCQS